MSIFYFLMAGINVAMGVALLQAGSPTAGLQFGLAVLLFGIGLKCLRSESQR